MCRIMRNDDLGYYIQTCNAAPMPNKRIAISQESPLPGKISCDRDEKELAGRWASICIREVFCHYCWKVVRTDHCTYDPEERTETWYQRNGWAVIGGHRACPKCAETMAPSEVAS